MLYFKFKCLFNIYVDSTVSLHYYNILLPLCLLGNIQLNSLIF